MFAQGTNKQTKKEEHQVINEAERLKEVQASLDSIKVRVHGSMVRMRQKWIQRRVQGEKCCSQTIEKKKKIGLSSVLD